MLSKESINCALKWIYLLAVKLANIPADTHMISSNASREEVRNELRIAGIAAELFFTVDNHSEADHSAD